MQTEPIGHDETAFDFSNLIKPIIQGRRGVIKVVIGFFVVGFLVGFMSETSYTADTVFIPQLSNSSAPSGISGSLGGLASLAGIDLESQAGGDFPPSLYPNLIDNIEFQMALLSAPLILYPSNDSITYREYYENIHRPSLLSTIKKYTLGLPGQILTLFQSDSQGSSQPSLGNFIEVSGKDKVHITRLLRQMGIMSNVKDGYVSLSFEMPDKYLAAQMANHFESLIHEELINYKTNKVQIELSYIEGRYNERKRQFSEIQDKLALFRDENQNLTTAASQNEQQRLESEYDLAFTIYNDLARQLEDARLKVSKDTPLITTIKPITIPLKKTAPRKVLIIMIFLIAGVGIGVSRVYLVLWLREVKLKLESSTPN